MSTELVNLDPKEILLSGNVRFSIKPSRVERLAEEILSAGGVHTPITVERLNEPQDGHEYRLVLGKYRTTAVDKLNSEQSAGLTIPARVVPQMTDAERLKLQTSENNERENMSPMDKAITIKQMIDAGVQKIEIRKSFSAPGGRKGTKIAPLSNSMMNILLSFLDFPKAIQNKIHEGLVGVAAAMELQKKPKEKWEEILSDIEASRIKDVEKEEKLEEAYLAQTKKASEKEQQLETAQKSLETVKAEAEEAERLAKEKAELVGNAMKSWITAKQGSEEKKKANEHKKAAEQELKAAQQIADQKAKEAAKLQEKAQSLAEQADSARKRLEDARKAKAAKKSVSATEVKKASKGKATAEDKPVKLNASEMREAIKELTINGKPKVKLIGLLLFEAFDGKITDGALRIGIGRITGEEPMPKTTQKA